MTASVLPAGASNQSVTWSTDNANVTLSATTGATVTVTGAVAGTSSIVTVTTVEGGFTATATITVNAPGDIVDPTEYTLIAGVRWATRNVGLFGTFAPLGQVGMMYIWGNNEAWYPGPDVLSVPSGLTTWPTNAELTGVNNDWNGYVGPCPTGWRLPTLTEFRSLVEAGAERVLSPDRGYYFGTAPNRIFLPETGRRNSNVSPGGWGMYGGTGGMGFYFAAPVGDLFNGLLVTTGPADTGAGRMNRLQFNMGGTGLPNTTPNDRVHGQFVRCVLISSAPVPPVPVTDVTLNTNAYTLNVGGTTSLTASVLPANASNQNVTWSTDNANVTLSATTGATVTVTGAVAGTSSIVTVTTVDGGFTATATITVDAVSVPVTGVTLNTDEAIIDVDGTVNLTAAVLPAGASNQNVTWSTDNTNVTLSATTGATVTVTGAVAGSTSVVTVTTEDGGHYAIATITVNAPGSDVVDADQFVLIAGTRWATRNVATVGTFAASPESPGLLYQWGSNVGWTPEAPSVPSVEGATWQTLGVLNAVESWNPCPQGWRLPTEAELRVIVDIGPGIVGTVNGTPGRWFPGAPGAVLPPDTSELIFIPGAGRNNADGVWAMGLPQGTPPVPFGFLWTSTIEPGAYRMARLSFRPSPGQPTVLGFDNPRTWGFSVRCVQI